MSRLDRLLNLLDTGSTAATRKAAADHLGGIIKAHPDDLQVLLVKVLPHLKSKNWDTRVAAGQAIESICRNFARWNPRPSNVRNSEETTQVEDRLSLQDFDVLKVLERAAPLLASGGKEFDVDWSTMDPKVARAKQRQNLLARIGLGEKFGGLDDAIEDVDLDVEVKPEAKTDLRGAGALLAEQIHLSSREKLRAKRKAKKSAGKGFTSPDSTPRAQGTITAHPLASDSAASLSVDSLRTDPDHWPFERICEILIQDLFDPVWEVRHGAGTGLREILKLHGADAGKIANTSSEAMQLAQREWAEDCLVRLLCVLALDRFCDFVSDQVVAPVRETCAQVVGVFLQHTQEDVVSNVIHILITLLNRTDWETRLGAMLCMKYVIAVRGDLVDKMLPLVLDHLVKSLHDKDDDVRAVAAESILPICRSVCVQCPPDKIGHILSILWDSLLQLDELTASTKNVMDLLAEFYSQLQVGDEAAQPVPVSSPIHVLVPRLYPFLRHNISSVRLSALKTLERLVRSHAEKSDGLSVCVPTLCRLVFQNILTETSQDVASACCSLWSALMESVDPAVIESGTEPSLQSFIVLLSTPCGAPFDVSLWLKVPFLSDPSEGFARPDTLVMPEADTHIQIRIAAARALAQLLARLSPSGCRRGLETLTQLCLSAHWHSYRLAGALVAEELGRCIQHSSINKREIEQDLHVVTDRLVSVLVECEDRMFGFMELMAPLQHIRAEAAALVECFRRNGVGLSTIDSLGPVADFTVEQATDLVSRVFYEWSVAISSVKSEGTLTSTELKEERESRRRTVMLCLETYQALLTQLNTSLVGSFAAAVISLGPLPAKLNPIIKSLLTSCKREQNPQLQRRTCVAIAALIELCLERKPCPNDKIIRSLCQQATESLSVLHLGSVTSPSVEGNGDSTANTEPTKLKRTQSSIGKDKQPTPALPLEKHVSKRGSEWSLIEIAKRLGPKLFTALPAVWQCVSAKLFEWTTVETVKPLPEGVALEIAANLHVMATLTPVLHEDLLSTLLTFLPRTFQCLRVSDPVLRAVAAECAATICQRMTSLAMPVLIERLLPMLSDIGDENARLGSAETIKRTVTKLDIRLLPYAIFLVVPLLGRMSDSSRVVRETCSYSFANIVALLPLESGVSDPVDMDPALKERRHKERRFIDMLLDHSQVDNFELPIALKADLRTYQREGINWLSFLCKFNLHGILCDEMGLGKTLQTICIIASEIYEKKRTQQPLNPSLVVCPSTLVAHWVSEIERFVPSDVLRAGSLAGKVDERGSLDRFRASYDVLVMSYETVRKFVNELSKQPWHFCVLDEGHIIKNPKTKLTQAVKQLRCDRRLILSGTPIQNNVLELWSLFDFLMPGYLGTEREFQETYSRPILNSRDAKASSREQEAGTLALESLHRQVLPFLLRRMKDDVLKDLPPKIIQDLYCDLSPLQIQLYEDFSKASVHKEIENLIETPDGDEEAEEPKLKRSKPSEAKGTHVFQALQYLRKLCNHPLLVFNEHHPQYSRLCKEHSIESSHLHDLKFAPKLQLLRELLLECGIGQSDAAVEGTVVKAEEDLEKSTVTQHRALVFCQMKEMLNIIETDLFHRHMPSVTYLRLDGSIEPSKRFSIVTQFNNDPTIDVLLLTTSVGGLGLNLTGADTVIFMEHDWNPTKDLQAMDRAHRIGQKKVVNVYRLITRGTLEEKIMGLQKFKTHIANSVVTADNASLKSMDTSQLLDLFSAPKAADTKREPHQAAAAAGGGGGDQAEGSMEMEAAESVVQPKKGLKALLSGLEELWDDSQYKEEYNIDKFLDSLKE